MNTLAKKYDELKKLEEEYKEAFGNMCRNALLRNELTGKQTAYPESIPAPKGYVWKEALEQEYKGEFNIVDNYGDPNIPFRFHFKPDKKAEGDVIPAFQRIFTPTVEQSDDLTKWVKDSVCPLFEKKEK